MMLLCSGLSGVWRDGKKLAQRAKKSLTNTSLILDVAPQGPQQGKETRDAGGDGEHVPTDGNGDDQVKRKYRRGGRGGGGQEEHPQEEHPQGERPSRKASGEQRGCVASKEAPVGEQGVGGRAGRGDRCGRVPAADVGEMDRCLSERLQGRGGKGGGEDRGEDQTAALFRSLLT